MNRATRPSRPGLTGSSRQSLLLARAGGIVLEVAPSSTTAIDLRWTDGEVKEDGFKIERSTDGVSFTEIATVSSGVQSYNDTGLTESVEYWYRVREYLGSDNFPYSNIASTWTVPSTPTGLTATAISSTQIDLAWSDVSTGNTAQSIQRRSPAGSGSYSFIASVSATATSYNDTGLTASTQYEYQVAATNPAAQSAWSTAANATTTGGGPTAAWLLDFSSGTPSGYTLTRASSGTFVDSSGYVASASTDVARLTHNSSGSRLGLLVEGQRTNYIRGSEDLNAQVGDTAGATVTLNDGTAPDNTTTADRLELTSTGYRYKLTKTSLNAGTYTGSVYVKQKSAGQTINLRVNGTSSGSVSSQFTTTGDWQRITLTLTTTTAQQIQVGIDQRTGLGGPGTSCDILMWGFQLEEGSKETSYIPNFIASGFGTDVTRSADLAHVLDSSITSWGDPGALVVHFYPPGQAGTLISTDDASTAQVGIEASTTTAARAFWSSGSTATGTIGTGVQKSVHYWNGSTSKFCINGGTVQSGTNNFTIANADFVTLGAEATDSAGVPGTFSQYANCVIRKVEFYSGTLTDANLQTITT